MSAAGLLKYSYLAYFSQPAHERLLYRAIRRGRLHSIVELGAGVGLRARRLIVVAQRYHHPDQSQSQVRYTGVDLFETRSVDLPGMTLKQAHRLLSPLGASVQLVPGDPYSALARTANSLTGTDLVIISAEVDAQSLQRAWYYLPRMLHGASQVFLEEAGESDQPSRYHLLDRLTISRLAQQADPHLRRAA